MSKTKSSWVLPTEILTLKKKIPVLLDWPMNWCFWTVVLEKTLKSDLDCKEIKLVNPKGNQSWIFIGRTDAEAETPILWPPDVKSWLIRKSPDPGKDWGQEEKGMTENKMVRWHHRLNGHEFCASSGSWWWWAGKPVMLQSMGSQSQTRLSNSTELIGFTKRFIRVLP